MGRECKSVEIGMGKGNRKIAVQILQASEALTGFRGVSCSYGWDVDCTVSVHGMRSDRFAHREREILCLCGNADFPRASLP